MVKRLLSASTSEVMQFNGQQLKESIKASEGRIIVSENIVTQENLDSITTAEIAVPQVRLSSKKQKQWVFSSWF